MNDDILYFERNGRRPATIIAAVAIAGFALLGILYGAPWWWNIVIGLICFGTVCVIIANPCSSMTLNKTELIWSTGKRETRHRLDEIDHITFTPSSDSADDVNVVLHSGERIAIPSTCLPPKKKLVEALERFGISVK